MLDIFEYVEGRGIQVVRDDGTELACYCPFHSNSDTPAFYINKNTGLWICFNPSCGKTGSLRDLMEFFGDHRKIVKDYSLDEIQQNLVVRNEDRRESDWESILDQISISLPEDSDKVKYLLDRGFTQETLQYFDVAFSGERNRIVIPARNERYKIVGFIGRAVSSDVNPKYLYSKGFPRKDILFNLNNAKRHSSCVIVEGSLDAMMVHQAGFPNVVASLGATITENHLSLLSSYFDSVTVFSDNDHAGYAMRDEIIKKCHNIELKIVNFKNPEVKDPGEMSSDQIAEHIEDAVDYFTWSFNHVH